jgi:hypothetical protein
MTKVRTILARVATRVGGTDPQAGNLTVLAATMALGLFLMVGLVVDGGGRALATAHAADAAAAAADAAGQAVDLTRLRAGGGLGAEPRLAAAAARSYLAAAGVTGTVTITGGGRRIEVNTTTNYNPVFLVGIASRPVTGHAVADLLAVQQGTEMP